MFYAIKRFFKSNINPGLKIIAVSVCIGALSAFPLMLYVLLGPRNGNPVGIGLLFFLGMIVAQLGVLFGAVWFVIAYFVGRKR